MEAIEEAVETFRAAGIARCLTIALCHAALGHLELAEVTGALDRDRALALCREGEPLAEAMGDQHSLAFFRQHREALEAED